MRRACFSSESHCFPRQLVWVEDGGGVEGDGGGEWEVFGGQAGMWSLPLGLTGFRVKD